MTATELISLIVRSAFVFIGAITLVDYLRFRSSARLDIALMFATLAGVILGSAVRQAVGTDSPWGGTLIFALLVTQPYLLLRLVEHFQPVPRRITRLAMGGLVVSYLLLLGVALTVLPAPAAIVLLLYFIVVEAYATWLFARISRRSSGSIRLRTLFAALGSGWLAATMLATLLPILLPAAAAFAGGLLQFFALLSVVSYYLGFAPPAALRRAWQLAELQRFLRRSAARPIAERLAGALEDLCPAVTHSVGAMSSGIWLRQDQAGAAQFVLSATDRAGWQPAPLTGEAGSLALAEREKHPVQADTPEGMGQALAAVAAELGARTVIVAPIGLHERRWGVLLAFRAQPSLFPGDDAEVLRLFAAQAAEALESGELFRQQQALVEQLELANKDLESFSYSVSHDLRAPLRALSGFSQVLLEDHLEELSDTAQHYVRRIQNNSQKMGRLVDDLLAFSRFGRQPLKLQATDPASVARQAWDDLRHDHEGRAVRFDLEKLPWCLADASLLRQVYINLLSNALKFTRQRSLAQITVGCRAGEAGLVYFVRDNGVGFDMAYANKLFGVFQRLHRAEDFEGTGVGLAIVARIIERHGGRVSAESVVEQGTTFFFSLKGVET